MSNFIGDFVENNKDNQFNMTEPTLDMNNEYYIVKVEMLDENQEIKIITFRGTYAQMQNLYNNSLKHFEKISLKKMGYDLLKISSDGQDTAVDSIGGYGISNDDGNMYLGM